MEKKDKLLPIGQFAALHGVNKKTLMWYDEVGLFRPAVVNSQNGYRYYSYQQSQTLETILLLREMGVSVKEIKAFMQERSAASMEKLLGEKIEELDREISHKKAVRETLAKHRRNMQTLLSMDLEEISIVEKKGRRLVTVELSADTSFEKAVEMITDETKKYQLSYLHDASYGSMIAVESLYAGNFEAMMVQVFLLKSRFLSGGQGCTFSLLEHTSALFTEGPGRIWIYVIGKSFPMRKSRE